MDYRFNLLSELDSLSENGTIIISRPLVNLTWEGGGEEGGGRREGKGEGEGGKEERICG